MKKHVFIGLVVASSFLLLPGLRAQGADQQIVNDAATALGGRDKILAVKTLLVEGAGHDMSMAQSLRFDEMDFQSDVNQIRDYKRAYDLGNGRARFEQVRETQYPFYTGEGGLRQVQGLDGQVAFNVPPNGNAARIFGAQAVARQAEYLRHPLTLVRAALGPSAKL